MKTVDTYSPLQIELITKTALDYARVAVQECTEGPGSLLATLREFVLAEPELMASVRVVDPAHIEATVAAREAIEFEYLTVPWVVARYAEHFRRSCVTRATRGKLKGNLIVQRGGSIYAYPTASDVILVFGTTVTVECETVRVTRIAVQSELDPRVRMSEQSNCGIKRVSAKR